MKHAIAHDIRAGRTGDATQAILAAYRRTGYVALDTAYLLGVSYATLHRWVEKLALQPEIARRSATAKEAGHKVERRGRPLGSRDSSPRARRAAS